jgi:hypothetical protein
MDPFMIDLFWFYFFISGSISESFRRFVKLRTMDDTQPNEATGQAYINVQINSAIVLIL